MARKKAVDKRRHIEKKTTIGKGKHSRKPSNRNVSAGRRANKDRGQGS